MFSISHTTSQYMIENFRIMCTHIQQGHPCLLRKCLGTELLVVICGQHVPPAPTCRDFYLWVTPKKRVYKSNPHTTEELKKGIQGGFSQYPKKNVNV
jgi:hypothetical protein